MTTHGTSTTRWTDDLVGFETFSGRLEVGKTGGFPDGLLGLGVKVLESELGGSGNEEDSKENESNRISQKMYEFRGQVRIEKEKRKGSPGYGPNDLEHTPTSVSKDRVPNLGLGVEPLCGFASPVGIFRSQSPERLLGGRRSEAGGIGRSVGDRNSKCSWISKTGR